jgi:hypothetical protein
MIVAVSAVVVAAGCSAPLPEAKRTFTETDAGPGSTASTTSTFAPTSTALAVTTVAPGPDGPVITPVPTSAPDPAVTTTTIPRRTATTNGVDPDNAKASAIGSELVAAWGANDRAAAAKVATPNVVSQLFDVRYAGPYAFAESKCSGGVGNFLCDYESKTMLVQLWIAHEAGVPMVVRGIHVIPRP